MSWPHPTICYGLKHITAFLVSDPLLLSALLPISIPISPSSTLPQGPGDLHGGWLTSTNPTINPPHFEFTELSVPLAIGHSVLVEISCTPAGSSEASLRGYHSFHKYFMEPHGLSSLVVDTRVMECYNDCLLFLSVDRPPSAGIQGPGHFNLCSSCPINAN